MGINCKVTINKTFQTIVFQSLKALVGSITFHGVMAGCLKCQGAHITEGRECDRKRGIWVGKYPSGRNV